MSRRGESVYKRKDGRWEARYIHHYEDGVAKYRYLYAHSYWDVKLKRLAEQTEERTARPASRRETALCDVGELWLADTKNAWNL